MLPGGFAEAILGQAATPETVAAFNKEIGLDRPAVSAMSNGSAACCRAISALPMPAAAAIAATSPRCIAPRALQHFFLAVMTALIAVPLSLGARLLAALYRNSLV